MCLTLRLLLDGTDIHDRLDVEVNRVSSRHHVLEIDVLGEGLGLDTLKDLLLTHLATNRSRISINTNNKSMRELALFASFLKDLHDDSLASGEASREHYDDLSWLETV